MNFHLKSTANKTKRKSKSCGKSACTLIFSINLLPSHHARWLSQTIYNPNKLLFLKGCCFYRWRKDSFNQFKFNIFINFSFYCIRFQLSSPICRIFMTLMWQKLLMNKRKIIKITVMHTLPARQDWSCQGHVFHD